MTLKAIYLRAANLVREGWCQHVLARDKNGNKLYVGDLERAVAHCVLGSMTAANDMELEDCDAAWLKLDALVRNRHGVSALTWNDASERTQDEVVDLLLELAYRDDDLNEAFQTETERETT